MLEGPSFDFLGMDIHLLDNGKAQISVVKQIKEALDWFGENITKRPKTEANKNLFTITDKPELDKKKSKTFHSVVAKLLYLMLCARPDIRLAVAFLWTRVSKSTTKDCTKL